jgi:phage shock protein PspC (stress-responsive transcriptional regulator)
MTGIYESMWRNGLVRPLDGRLLGGVCAGLARRFGIDPWPMRWLFLIVLIVLPGSPLLIYPLLWIFMPGEDWVARVHGPSASAQPYPGSAPASPTYTAQPYAAQPYAAQPYAGQPSADGPSADGPSAPQTPADGPR